MYNELIFFFLHFITLFYHPWRHNLIIGSFWNDLHKQSKTFVWCYITQLITMIFFYNVFVCSLFYWIVNVCFFISICCQWRRQTKLAIILFLFLQQWWWSKVCVCYFVCFVYGFDYFAPFNCKKKLNIIAGMEHTFCGKRLLAQKVYTPNKIVKHVSGDKN